MIAPWRSNSAHLHRSGTPSASGKARPTGSLRRKRPLARIQPCRPMAGNTDAGLPVAKETITSQERGSFAAFAAFDCSRQPRWSWSVALEIRQSGAACPIVASRPLLDLEVCQAAPRISRSAAARASSVTIAPASMWAISSRRRDSSSGDTDHLLAAGGRRLADEEM